MHGSIKGALKRIDTSHRFFEHLNTTLTIDQLRQILMYGLEQGYRSTAEIDDSDILYLLSLEDDQIKEILVHEINRKLL